jgi:hypothetical protein
MPVSIIPGSKYQPIRSALFVVYICKFAWIPQTYGAWTHRAGVAVPGVAVPGVTVPGLAVPGLVALGATVLGFVAASLPGQVHNRYESCRLEQLTGSEHEPSAAIPNARDNMIDRFINRRFLAQWLARSLRLAAETTSLTDRPDIPHNPSRSPSPSPPVAAFPVHRSPAALPLASSR